MVVANMKEACLYVEQARKNRAAEHRRLRLQYGACSGLTDAEYNRVRYQQKKTFSKARKFTHNRMWKYQTRYSVEQLKEILKT
jgi:hypothetical protein